MLKLRNLILVISFVVLSELACLWNSAFMNAGSILLWKWNKNTYIDSGICFYDNDYIISPAKSTSTDYEFEQLCILQKKLEKDDIHLLYVNKPTKYLDDSIFRKFGIKSSCNDNADRLLERLGEAGIDCLDLRSAIKAEGLDIYSMFYRTDHHWTVPSGKWGAEKIAQHLNESAGYNIDTGIYDDMNYDFRTTPDAWYGEQGAKFEGSSLQKDDYTLITPNFPTRYLIDEEETDFTTYFISDPQQCFHYNYKAKDCINADVSDGSILMLGDSYDMITEPFLSLGVHEIDFIILRDYMVTDIYERFIKEKNYDTVIVCYASFMIGAHDDPDSANYKMFTFSE